MFDTIIHPSADADKQTSAYFLPRPAFSPPAPTSLLPPVRPPRLVRSRFHKPRRELEHMLRAHWQADYRLHIRRRSTGHLPGFISNAKLITARHEFEFGLHLEKAIKEGVSKLVLEVDIADNAADGETTRTRRIYASTPDYDGFAICQALDSGSYTILAEPFGTREEALAEIARRKPTLPRGVRLNIMGLYADGRNDTTDLLQYDVTRY